MLPTLVGGVWANGDHQSVARAGVHVVVQLATSNNTSATTDTVRELAEDENARDAAEGENRADPKDFTDPMPHDTCSDEKGDARRRPLC